VTGVGRDTVRASAAGHALAGCAHLARSTGRAVVGVAGLHTRGHASRAACPAKLAGLATITRQAFYANRPHVQLACALITATVWKSWRGVH